MGLPPTPLTSALRAARTHDAELRIYTDLGRFTGKLWYPSLKAASHLDDRRVLREAVDPEIRALREERLAAEEHGGLIMRLVIDGQERQVEQLGLVLHLRRRLLHLRGRRDLRHRDTELRQELCASGGRGRAG